METSPIRLKWTWIESLLVLAVAVWVLSCVVNARPFVDEYYHVLAAQSLLETGTLSINGGEPYTRARGFTYAVAACHQWFGESWASLRLPALLCGGLLVMSVFFWLHRTVSRPAAWLGAGLLLFTPHVLIFSSMVRFYMPHLLFVWCAWACAYFFIACSPGRVGRIGWLLAGLICALIAAHLQTTTSIAALAIGVWAGTVYIGYLMHCSSGQRRKAILWLGVLLVIGVPLFIAGLKLTGAWDHMAQKLTVPRLWTEPHRYEYQYYHRFFDRFYPLIWATFPVMALAALAHRRKPAWFCLVLFCTAFIVHSLLPTKSKRYLSYAWPCLFVVWAIGLDGVLVWLRVQMQAVVSQVFSDRLAKQRWVSGVISCVLIGALLFGWMVAPSYKYGRKMLAGELYGPMASVDWFLAAETLKPIVDETGYVVGSSQPNTLYHLGRLDICLSVSQAQLRPEFAVHPKMNQPVITSVVSLERVMAEQPTGLIVIAAGHFGDPYFVPTATARFIETHLEPIELPEATGIKAYRWGGSTQPVSDPVSYNPES